MAGVRTPQQITLEGSRRWAALQGISEEERASKYPSLEEAMPEMCQRSHRHSTKTRRLLQRYARPRIYYSRR